MKNPAFHFLLAVLILLTLLHSTTIFAMDSKATEEVMEEVIDGIEQFCGDEVNQGENSLEAASQLAGGNQSTEINQIEYSNKTNNQQLTSFITINSEKISDAENAFRFVGKSPLSTTRVLSKLATANEVQGVYGAEKFERKELIDGSGVDISLPSSVAAAVPTAYSLQPIVSIPPVGRLGDYILSLPPELIGEFLRSPEPKQAAYKTEHEQTVQELQAQYPNLVDKIATWNQVVEAWNRSSIPEVKEACYQNVIELASEMPSELYRLVALSQAIKVIEDAIAYSYYLPHAWEKYDKDVQTEEARTEATRSKIILLAQIDTINNNILNLEKAADAVLRLSEQRHRCLAGAAVAAITQASRIKIAEQFQIAARAAEEAIASYLQFAQKMREGDVYGASLFRRKGFYLECDVLKKKFKAEGNASGDGSALENCSGAVHWIFLAQESFKKAVQAKSEGQVEIVKAFEQAAQYYYQGAQSVLNGDRKEMCYFISQVRSASSAADALKQAAQAKSESQLEAAKAFEQAAQYYFQVTQIAINGEYEKRSRVLGVAHMSIDIAMSLKQAAQAKSQGNVEIATVFEKAAYYQFQGAQAAISGDTIKEKNFSNLYFYTIAAAEALKQAAQARGESQIEIVKVFEQVAQYYFEATQVALNGDSMEAYNFFTAGNWAGHAAKSLKKAVQAMSDENIQAAQDYEQEVHYYLRRAEIYAQEGQKRGDAFLREIYDEELRLREGVNERKKI